MRKSGSIWAQRLQCELASCCTWPAPIGISRSRMLSMRAREGGTMEQEIHLVREHLFEASKLCERLSSQLSDQKIPADLAPIVEALRASVLSAVRVAHVSELAAKLAGSLEGS